MPDNPDKRCRRVLWFALLLLVSIPMARAQAIEWGGSQTWAFEPAQDTFSAGALLDLRSLNEKTAGETGFVRVDGKGDFVRGDGQPLRFWAVNSSVANHTDATRPLWAQGIPNLARHARFLAKRGVNMVRLHQQLSPNLVKNPGAVITDINEAERDAIWRTVAAMRKEGIYTTISPYWAVPMKFSAAWGIAGDARQSALGLLFFDEPLQAAYKVWLRKLLTEKNPHTGLTLAQDASVAIFQLQNEDSLLFWTVNGIKGPQRQALERRYGEFLMQKYGSRDNLLSAWKGAGDAADAPADGRWTLLNIWEMTQTPRRLPIVGDLSDLRGGKATRLADQTEFYARTMHTFNRKMVDFLRQDLGVKQLVNAGNWKTASSVHLNDAERWSYTAADVDAANVYTGGIHKGPNEGWAIVNGDKFTSDSVLLNPRLLPINLKQTLGQPMLLTEGGWILPNGFAAEGPFLIAAYSSLTGVDGFYWFATRNEEGWTPPQSANGYLPSQGKWLFGTPDILGSFPAAALAYRLGYIRRGAPAVLENRTMQDLWDRKTPILAEAPSFDPNRDAGDIASASSVKTGVSPDAFLVGPVQVAFGKDPAQSRAGPFDKLIEPGRVKSNTGELVFNHALGFSTVDATHVQGVAAHFGRAPTHQLQDVQFTSGNVFGAAMAVSLDGAPLKISKRILLQYATQSRPTGWRDRPVPIKLENGQTLSGFEVVSYGQSPWQVIKAELDVTVNNINVNSATVLDMNGMATQTLALSKSKTGVSLRFPSNAMYVILH
ncbi:MAG TPA: hypothetical protein PK497_10430 [Burkholderiaceae bacterium]|nr:hypothetical protein [Burkholderiaceae bacterium]